MTARVLVVAHFPPPVHGMATAVGRLVAELETRASVLRINIAAPTLNRRSVRYHVVRVARVVRAASVMVRERRRAATALLSCDAGSGMIYTLLLAVLAGTSGYRVYLQHHSYAYVLTPSRVLATLVSILGKRCTHLVTCPTMRDQFRNVYPGARVEVVGVAGGVSVLRSSRRRDPGTLLVLGFLGNLTLDKGLDTAIETARRAQEDGLHVELRVAGPPADVHAQHTLDGALADPAVPVRYVGPMKGEERDVFLDEVDVFLFPSRYVHESFGLVAWEAMARGVPLIAHQAGCLTADAVGAGGLVVGRDEPFADRALPVLRRWSNDPELRERVGEDARRVAARVVASSERDVERLCSSLVGGPSCSAAGG